MEKLEREGFDSKSRKMVKSYCARPTTIKGGKGSIKRQAFELQKDPEVLTSHHKKHRPRSHSHEAGGWPSENFLKRYAKHLPNNDYNATLTPDMKAVEIICWKNDEVL